MTCSRLPRRRRSVRQKSSGDSFPARGLGVSVWAGEAVGAAGAAVCLLPLAQPDGSERWAGACGVASGG